MAETEQNRRYIWLIVLQSLLYGVMDVVSKQAYQVMSVYCFLFLRYLLAAGIMLLLWHRQLWAELKAVPPSRYLVPGLCMSSAFIFSNLALVFTSATNLSFLRSLSALIVPLLALLFCRQACRKRDLLLQGLMLVGLYLLCARGGLGRFGLGEVFALTAATLVAGSLVFGKETLRFVSAKTLSFVQTLLAVLFCGCAAAAAGSLGDAALAGRPELLAALLYAAVGCTIAGYLLQNVALKHISAQQIGIVQCLYPIATALLAFAVLGEALSPAGILGAAIITGCVLLENAL